MKKLMTGNEAIARGAWEAGVHYASAYPGTPSTEILENIATYKEDIVAEWGPNEKVALEMVIGAAFAGGRSLAAMKHVGVNVATDPLFTVSYTGVNGGLVLVSADEPGHFSSQNEQDNRNYAKFAKIAMLEPSNSQEAKDMTKIAFDISEKYDTPVLLRMTTRVCHSKSIVSCEERENVAIKKYEKNWSKRYPVPGTVNGMRVRVEERLDALKIYSEETPLNVIEWHDKKIGVVASGVAFSYAKEVFGDTVSYLKLGFTNPLPAHKIKTFCEGVDKVYVIEENDPYIEEFIKILGFECEGSSVLPYTGEMTPEVIRKAILGTSSKTTSLSDEVLPPRPPSLCAGCPHRGFFLELKKRKAIVSSDIGCYGLASLEPYNVGDFCICMGASLSMGHGAQRVFDMKQESEQMRVVSVLGDSTFFHTGINSLLTVAYNGSNTINVILDNRITGMTGHQENPGTGYTLQGKKTRDADIEAMVRATGIDQVRTIDPNKLSDVKEAFDWAFALDEPSVIITKWPCVLKKFSDEDKIDFADAFQSSCKVDPDKCIGCRACIRTGCPAISFNKETKKSSINSASCVGCEVCLQVCPVKAIQKEV